MEYHVTMVGVQIKEYDDFLCCIWFSIMCLEVRVTEITHALVTKIILRQPSVVYRSAVHAWYLCMMDVWLGKRCTCGVLCARCAYSWNQLVAQVRDKSCNWNWNSDKSDTIQHCNSKCRKSTRQMENVNTCTK